MLCNSIAEYNLWSGLVLDWPMTIYSFPPSPPYTYTEECWTVSALWERINKEKVYIRGTPASGKSTLANFLERHVLRVELDMVVHNLSSKSISDDLSQVWKHQTEPRFQFLCGKCIQSLLPRPNTPYRHLMYPSVWELAFSVLIGSSHVVDVGSPLRICGLPLPWSGFSRQILQTKFSINWKTQIIWGKTNRVNFCILSKMWVVKCTRDGRPYWSSEKNGKYCPWVDDMEVHALEVFIWLSFLISFHSRQFYTSGCRN